MPAYEYEIPTTPIRFVLLRTIERRDDPVLIQGGAVVESGERLPGWPANPGNLPDGYVPVRRIPVPTSITIPGTVRDPWNQDNQVQDAYRYLEERGKLAPWMIPPAEAKAALALPEPDEPNEAEEAELFAKLDEQAERGNLAPAGRAVAAAGVQEATP